MNRSSIGFPIYSRTNSLKDSFTDLPYFFSHKMLSLLSLTSVAINFESRMNLTNDSSKIPGKEQKKKYTNLSHLKEEQKNNNYTQ